VAPVREATKDILWTLGLAAFCALLWFAGSLVPESEAGAVDVNVDEGVIYTDAGQLRNSPAIMEAEKSFVNCRRGDASDHDVCCFAVKVSASANPSDSLVVFSCAVPGDHLDRVPAEFTAQDLKDPGEWL
jgi:hypothetical protein